jgi:hypothetical protein
MSRILLTGMTAPQASQRANERSQGFAHQLVDALRNSDEAHEVDWIDPSVEWTYEQLDEYDSIIVGLAPVTGLGSNRAYGALSVIAHMYDSSKLRLFVDGPNPYQITHSFNAILKTPDTLTKEFYKYRLEWHLATEPTIRLRVYTAIRKLATEQWPPTLYPKLPWNQEDPRDDLPKGAREALCPINLDIFTLNHSYSPVSIPAAGVSEKWVVNDAKAKWCEFVEPTLGSVVVPMKRNKFSSDSDVISDMVTSVGVLVAPTKRGRTWWTNRYVQALHARVPVFTEWQDSQSLGESWATLGSEIEHMSDARRAALSNQQREAYVAAIDDESSATANLEKLLGLKEGKNV